MIKLTIFGEPCSKANSRQLVHRGGKPMFIKSKKGLDYEKNAMKQLPADARQMLEGELAVTMNLYYASERPDLDESIILDVLQSRFETSGMRKVCTFRGCYINDRQVREKHVFHHIDRVNPRAEIVITRRTGTQEALI